MPRAVPNTARVNLPVHGGAEGTFEIWFFVILDPANERAYWFRYELTREQGRVGAGMVWAAVFDGRREPSVLYGKAITQLALCRANDVTLDVRIGNGARMRHDALEGAVGDGPRSIAWSLAFEPAQAPSVRAPAWLEHLPLPMHAVHPNTEVPFTGWVDVGGERFPIAGARGMQAHVWGRRRPDVIQWVHATGLDGAPNGVLEIASVRAYAKGPAITFATLATPRVVVQATGLERAPFARVRSGDDWIVARAKTSKRVLVTHAHAERHTFAAYIYRDPAGHDLFVAQSDLASVEVEVFDRGHFGRAQPVHRVVAPAGALELHQPEPIAGLCYVGWPDEAPELRPRAPRSASRARPGPPEEGAFVDLPSPSRLFAAGLTYADHVAETASRQEPVIFEKALASWLPMGDRVLRPDDATVAAALDVVEPGLGRALLDRWGFVPPLLDYEVELGLYLLDDVDPKELSSASANAPRIGWFVANDLTSRTCQVLGEGTAKPLAFWACAKGFPGFCPVSPQMWIPRRRSFRAPRTSLTTWVRGERRQHTSTELLAVSVQRLLLAAAAASGGALRAGDALLTGTPSGIAFRVSRLKRALGVHLLDRFERLEAAFGMYVARPERFLGPGAEVTVDGGFLGSRTVRLS